MVQISSLNYILKLSFIIVLCDFVYFVMCRVVYVWVFYCVDVRGLCNNVSVDMVGNSIP